MTLFAQYLLDVTVLGDRFLTVTFYFLVCYVVTVGYLLILEAVMAYRRKMSKRRSRRSFSRSSGTHKRNLRGSPMRGGIRL